MIRNIIFLIVVGLFVSCSARKGLQSFSPKETLHTPEEIIDIMGKSKIVYTLDVLKEEFPDSGSAPAVLSNQNYRVKNKDGFILNKYELTREESEILNKGEEKFKDNEFDQALTYYKQLHKMKPDYAYALILIGDVFFNQEKYDSARVYFQRAIEKNPISYTAYWFLADTYWKTGDRVEALNTITKAHVLNRNHPDLLNTLKYYRGKIGIPWHEWKFNPQYKLAKKGNRVIVKFKPEWTGYALVKALWKYEPGYAESMIGASPDDYAFNMTEEAEAVISLIAGNKEMGHIKKIINDGYFKEFFYYEIVARENPDALLLLSDDELDRVAEYVIRYH